MLSLRAIKELSPGALRVVMCALALQELGDTPTPEAIADALNLSKSSVKRYMAAAVGSGHVAYDGASIQVLYKDYTEAEAPGTKSEIPREIITYRHIVKRYPPKDAWGQIIDALSDVPPDMAKAYYLSWIQKGYSPYNWAWVTRIKKDARGIFSRIEK